MIKLSDYLNYLSNEIIQARKLADENAVKIAKVYAKHEYLKYFRVPRFSMPTVKLEIPIKISDLEYETIYDFEMDEDAFVEDVNSKIRDLNQSKKLKLKPISKQYLKTEGFQSAIKTLKNTAYKSIQKNSDLLASTRKLQEKNIDSSLMKSVNDQNVSKIIKQSLEDRFKLVSSKLNNFYINPNTAEASDEKKIFVKLHVEMVEEGFRIQKVQDENGNEIEEVIFE